MIPHSQQEAEQFLRRCFEEDRKKGLPAPHVPRNFQPVFRLFTPCAEPVRKA